MAQTVKKSACNEADLGSIPGVRRSPGAGHRNPLQYSCLENSMDRGDWQATIHVVVGMVRSVDALWEEMVGWHH